MARHRTLSVDGQGAIPRPGPASLPATADRGSPLAPQGFAEPTASDTPAAQDLAASRAVAGAPATGLLARLRHSIAQLETSRLPTAPTPLALGIPAIDRQLPDLGLASGVLHEIMAATHGDGPAAVGFLFALTSLALKARPGLAVLVASQRAFAEWGRPYAQGLYQFGLDPGRLLLVETGSDKEALWAIEETLKSRVQPAMVTAVLASHLDLTASRRLNLAAAALATPLTLASPAKAVGVNAAATRWRIATEPAARDRFGALSHPRWRLSLERCRHGRPGKWFVEWNHVTHRFSLVESLANRSSNEGAGLRIAG